MNYAILYFSHFLFLSYSFIPISQSSSLHFAPHHASQALCMTPKECDNRRQRDITFVTSHPSSLWTKEILTDLVFLKKQQAKEEVNCCLFEERQKDFISIDLI